MKETPPTVRAAARDRHALDGADAQALEHALTITERERDRLRGEVSQLRQALESWEAEGCEGDWDGGELCRYHSVAGSDYCPPCRAERILYDARAAALREFGKHDIGCPDYFRSLGRWPEDRGQPCDCGLAAAIRGEP